jgi:hypothetical protein
MLEKWRAWSDCGGDVIGRFGHDFLLATDIAAFYESLEHP